MITGQHDNQAMLFTAPIIADRGFAGVLFINLRADREYPVIFRHHMYQKAHANEKKKHLRFIVKSHVRCLQGELFAQVEKSFRHHEISLARVYRAL
jgi:hypothetical protein